MRTIHFTILILSLALTSNSVAAQSNTSSSRRQQVLQKAIVDSTFIFGKWTEEGEGEIHLTYLGEVTTKHGKRFKIMNSIWIWGLSQRATSRILIFNGNDQYVGNYYLTMTTDLPTKIENGKLIFEHSDAGCDSKLTSKVDLSAGLPKQFFRKYKGESGDVFIFGTE